MTFLQDDSDQLTSDDASLQSTPDSHEEQIEVANDLAYNDDRDSFKVFMWELAQYPLLSHEEVCSLSKAIREDEPPESLEARNKLVAHNLRLVTRVAKRYLGMGLSHSDLISEGTFGLITAAERFDSEMGYTFTTYAWNWIRQSIVKALEDKASLIRTPSNLSGELYRLVKVERNLEQKLNRPATDEEIAAGMSVDVGRVARLREISQTRNVTSFETPTSKGEVGDEATTLGSLIIDTGTVTPEYALLESSMSDEIANALKTIPPKEEIALRMRYGLGYDREYTSPEIAEQFGVHWKTVSIWVKDSLRQLRTSPVSRHLRAFL